MSESFKNFLTFLIVAALLGLSIFFIWGKTNEVKSSADAQSNKALSVASQIDGAEFSSYDGGTITGSEVIGFMNSYNNSEEIGAIVKTTGSTDGINYLREFTDKEWVDPTTTGFITKAYATTVTFNKNFINAKEKTHLEYINPTAKFTPNLIKLVDGTVVGVQFTQK